MIYRGPSVIAEGLWVGISSSFLNTVDKEPEIPDLLNAEQIGDGFMLGGGRTLIYSWFKSALHF